MFLIWRTFASVSRRDRPSHRSSKRGFAVSLRLVQIVVMGISGSGKSTLAAILAKKLGCEWPRRTYFILPQTSPKWLPEFHSMTRIAPPGSRYCGLDR